MGVDIWPKHTLLTNVRFARIIPALQELVAFPNFALRDYGGLDRGQLLSTSTSHRNADRCA